MDSPKKQALRAGKEKKKHTANDGKETRAVKHTRRQIHRYTKMERKENFLENNYYTSKNKTTDACIEQFKKKIKECPFYICCVCNRILYRKPVIKLITSGYPSQDKFEIIVI